MRLIRTCVALMVSVVMTSSASADLTIGTWNLKHLGWNNGKQLDGVATIAERADLWALQEVMDAEAVTALERQLERQTGESWSSMASHEVGRNSYQESYAYLWRDATVEYTRGAVVYLDPGDLFAREPYLAAFRDTQTGQEVALATVHIVYGNNHADRTPEIRELAEIWTWMAEVYPETPRIIAGDYNLAPDHQAWQPLREQGARPAMTSGATTLSKTDGRYANLYDNLWFDHTVLHVSDTGIIRFPELLGITHAEARRVISDHAPVYITIRETASDVAETSAGERSPNPRDCIDLNSASASRLGELPNIGPARAKAIIEGRQWHAVEDLTNIDGIGLARMAEIKESGLLCPSRS